MDCTVNEKVCDEFGVKGYPNLKFFISGVPIPYKGPRDASSIDSWINSKLASTVGVLEAEEVHDKVGKEAFVLVSGLD